MNKLYIKKRLKYLLIVASACCVYYQVNNNYCKNNPSGYNY